MYEAKCIDWWTSSSSQSKQQFWLAPTATGIARQIKPQGGDDDDLLLLDDEDSPDTPDGGPTAGVPAPPEQPHPIPPNIPDMLHLYPTGQHCPPDCYS